MDYKVMSPVIWETVKLSVSRLLPKPTPPESLGRDWLLGVAARGCLALQWEVPVVLSPWRHFGEGDTAWLLGSRCFVTPTTNLPRL